MRNLKPIRRSLIAILSILTALAGSMALSSRANAANTAAVPGAVAVATDPARDAALKTFLQKHFKIPNPDLIKFGTPIETPIKGVFARPLVVSNEQGQSISTTLFYDKDATKAIIGQYLDLGAEPWGRMNMSGVHVNDNPSLGPADAPITIVEFADFECPFCAHAFSVLETMVNTTHKGQIKVIFKNYPLNVHPWAVKAAEAAECARLQNPSAFWEFARYFYTNQGSINPKNVQEHIDKQTAKLGLDAPSLKACMDSPAASDKVKQDQADGNAIKVTSTPTFFVNGIPVVGLPDGKVLDFVIASEMAEKPAAATASH
ncbi:MAG TPA: thioredoxin domain-containing protein [Candidatus Acidoferrales bacterium]|nr:thioredoxin domain-containing protein [Candidatus Acidoferrales bacterium]